MVKVKYIQLFSLVVGLVLTGIGVCLLDGTPIVIMPYIGGAFIGLWELFRLFRNDGLINGEDKLHWWDFRREKNEEVKREGK